MIIKQALGKTAEIFKKSRIKNPALEAEILLSYILKKPREFLFTHPEKKITTEQINCYKKLINRRLKGEPLAYLTGQKEFYGLNFFVNKNVLIPRPETELLVEEAEKRIIHNVKRTTLIDVGTGSGCIIITLAKQLDLRIKNYDLRMLGVDISKKALSVARKNAKFHGMDNKIKFVHGNLLKPVILNSKLLNHSSQIIILANLPYGWKEWKNNCSMETIGLNFEPKAALFTGKGGLELYEKLFKRVKKLLKSKSASLSIFCEIDPRQTKEIKKLAKRELPKAKLQIKKDLASRNRLMIAEI
ncbi:MAG: peptide chain release factor N(5)-glutamine methyltransferase [Patescibacteria group bacterium]|nr:peptide chain release factor N(5)-glutamine methyltransferase [Patescibacteria group bacterium]